MIHFFSEAQALQEEMSQIEPHIHENAEVGFELDKTIAFVTDKLRSYGYIPKLIGGGVICNCGNGNLDDSV